MNALGNPLPWSFPTDMRSAMAIDFTRGDLLAAVRRRLRALERDGSFSYGLLVLVGEQTRDEVEEAATTNLLLRERTAGRIVHEDGKWRPVAVYA